MYFPTVFLLSTLTVLADSLKDVKSTQLAAGESNTVIVLEKLQVTVSQSLRYGTKYAVPPVLYEQRHTTNYKLTWQRAPAKQYQ